MNEYLDGVHRDSDPDDLKIRIARHLINCALEKIRNRQGVNLTDTIRRYRDLSQNTTDLDLLRRYQDEVELLLTLSR